MRLRRARVQNYRSIKDSGWFDVDPAKTILVGPNEGGKTALLRALEQLNPGPLVRPFDPLHDFPRSEYYRIQSGELKPAEIVVAEAEYELSEDERAKVAAMAPRFSDVRYYRNVHLDNSLAEGLVNAPPWPTISSLEEPLRALAAHVDSRKGAGSGETTAAPTRSITELLEGILHAGPPNRTLTGADTEILQRWLDSIVAPRVDTGNEEEMSRLAMLRERVGSVATYAEILRELRATLPVMVYVSTYPPVTPIPHLGHLADAIDAGAIDALDENNVGNFCLLNILGFSARELSDLGKATEPEPGDTEGFATYRAQLDERDTRLNSASIRLTQSIREVWQPSATHTGTDYTIRVTADQQYLKVVVEDSLGIQVELDQRSQGFKWLVSFFVVFFAQALDRTRDAILLLDEPGMSLHGLKQREFRTTLSKLGEKNQLLFTTHSPFLVGPDELRLVRIVELVDRAVGTKVHNETRAEDPGSLLPLQEALAYELAAQLFSGEPTILFESLTDHWYVEATAALLGQAGMAKLPPETRLVPAGSVARLVYFATVLEAQELRLAALLDSDTRGRAADQQETLVQLLGHKRVVRTKDAYEGPVPVPTVEDLVRDTLMTIAHDTLGWDVGEAAQDAWGTRPIVDVFSDVVGPGFSRLRLAQEYVRWCATHGAADLSADERIQWMRMLENLAHALD